MIFRNLPVFTSAHGFLVTRIYLPSNEVLIHSSHCGHKQTQVYNKIWDSDFIDFMCLLCREICNPLIYEKYISMVKNSKATITIIQMLTTMKISNRQVGQKQYALPSRRV